MCGGDAALLSNYFDHLSCSFRWQNRLHANTGPCIHPRFHYGTRTPSRSRSRPVSVMMTAQTVDGGRRNRETAFSRLAVAARRESLYTISATQLYCARHQINADRPVADRIYCASNGRARAASPNSTRVRLVRTVVML